MAEDRSKPRFYSIVIGKELDKYKVGLLPKFSHSAAGLSFLFLKYFLKLNILKH